MEYAQDPEKLIFKHLYILKRYTDKGVISLMPSGYNMTYMPYFMSIGHTGISNHELVQKIMVTKQAVSKTVKELERLGLVYSRKSETDARSIMIFLTGEGKTLYEAISEMANKITGEYVKLIGAKKYEQFIDTFIKISAWHEAQEKLQ
ncbi:MarR family winged helix-turn-helix transcriptional regulator [Pedobacter lusitanus]|uniref:MarR family winged helix-turn-helix transcriptional regulator n=1 Tax=Pedobacter lusitanus TaxID=1503925 RepID=UPI0006964BA7|nr:MarR family transcriptional regulator [Pedobacter lusitanus]